MKTSIINCFCTNASNDSGNPAAVVVGFCGDKAEKQKYAAELGMPVTVFISDENSSIPVLEYYYPKSEMPLCLHGTLAAAYVLFENHTGNKIKCLTASGNPLTIERSETLIQVEVCEKPVSKITVNIDDIQKMLNLADINLIDRNLPLGVYSVGSPKLLIPIISSDAVSQLKPSFSQILSWSFASQVNGLYVYTKKTSEKFFARGFNPKTGYNEDAATGVAAAALALCLKQNILIEQGHSLNRESEIIITYHNEKSIFVGGKITAHIHF